jgi:hypothetical protein
VPPLIWHWQARRHPGFLPRSRVSLQSTSPPQHRRHHHNSMHGAPPLPASHPTTTNVPAASRRTEAPFRLGSGRLALRPPQAATGFAGSPLSATRGINDTGVHGIAQLSRMVGEFSEPNGTELKLGSIKEQIGRTSAVDSRGTIRCHTPTISCKISSYNAVARAVTTYCKR